MDFEQRPLSSITVRHYDEFGNLEDTRTTWLHDSACPECGSTTYCNCNLSEKEEQNAPTSQDSSRRAPTTQTKMKEVRLDDASWSLGLYTNEELEAMTDEEYEAARAKAGR